MYRRILMPTDGSACAQQAIEQGLELAQMVGAHVTFLHVLENPLTVAYAAPEAMAYSSELHEGLRESAEQVLAEAKAQAERVGVEADTRLVEDRDPAEAIQDVEDDYDLVVMGTHGRRGVNRWMFGSVAEGAVRRSSKPFLLIRSPEA